MHTLKAQGRCQLQVIAMEPVSQSTNPEFTGFPVSGGNYHSGEFCDETMLFGKVMRCDAQLVGKTVQPEPRYLPDQFFCDLYRYLSILRRLIFESSVRVGMPSFAAAPVGP